MSGLSRAALFLVCATLRCVTSRRRWAGVGDYPAGDDDGGVQRVLRAAGQVPSDGIPYPVFAFAALLPWQLFAFSLTESSNSLVGSQNLITKVYFPRLVIPLASVLAGW